MLVLVIAMGEKNPTYPQEGNISSFIVVYTYFLKAWLWILHAYSMSIGPVTRYQWESLSDTAVSQNVQLGTSFSSPSLSVRQWCSICLEYLQWRTSQKLHTDSKSHLRVGKGSRYTLKGRRAQHSVAVQTQEGKPKDWINQSCLQLFSRMGQKSEHAQLAAGGGQTAAPVAGLWPRCNVQSVLTWVPMNQCQVCSDTRQQCLGLCLIISTPKVISFTGDFLCMMLNWRL